MIYLYESRFDCNLLKIVLMAMALEYLHIARRSDYLAEISRNRVAAPEAAARKFVGLGLVVGNFIYIEFFCRAIRRCLIRFFLLLFLDVYLFFVG